MATTELTPVPAPPAQAELSGPQLSESGPQERTSGEPVKFKNGRQRRFDRMYRLANDAERQRTENERLKQLYTKAISNIFRLGFEKHREIVSLRREHQAETEQLRKQNEKLIEGIADSKADNKRLESELRWALDRIDRLKRARPIVPDPDRYLTKEKK